MYEFVKPLYLSTKKTDITVDYYQIEIIHKGPTWEKHYSYEKHGFFWVSYFAHHVKEGKGFRLKRSTVSEYETRDDISIPSFITKKKWERLFRYHNYLLEEQEYLLSVLLHHATTFQIKDHIKPMFKGEVEQVFFETDRLPGMTFCLFKVGLRRFCFIDIYYEGKEYYFLPREFSKEMKEIYESFDLS